MGIKQSRNTKQMAKEIRTVELSLAELKEQFEKERQNRKNIGRMNASV